MPIEYYNSAGRTFYARLSNAAETVVELTTGNNAIHYVASDAAIVSAIVTPGDLPAGSYTYAIQEDLGTGPDVTDEIVGEGSLEWNGTAEEDGGVTVVAPIVNVGIDD